MSKKKLPCTKKKSASKLAPSKVLIESLAEMRMQHKQLELGNRNELIKSAEEKKNGKCFVRKNSSLKNSRDSSRAPSAQSMLSIKKRNVIKKLDGPKERFNIPGALTINKLSRVVKECNEPNCIIPSMVHKEIQTIEQYVYQDLINLSCLKKDSSSQTNAPITQSSSCQSDFIELHGVSNTELDNSVLTVNSCSQTNYCSTDLQGDPLEMTVYQFSYDVDSPSDTSEASQQDPCSSADEASRLSDPYHGEETNKCQSNPYQAVQETAPCGYEQANKCQTGLTKLQMQCQAMLLKEQQEAKKSSCEERENKCKQRCQPCQPLQACKPCQPQKKCDSSFGEDMFRPKFFSKKNSPCASRSSSKSRPCPSVSPQETRNSENCLPEFKRFDACDIPQARIEFTRNVEKTIQVLDATFTGTDPKKVYGFCNTLKFMKSLKDDHGNTPQNLCQVINKLEKSGSKSI